jgi:hypothetical protein
MQRPYLFVIFMFFKLTVFAQLHESFSDSNFTTNPVWLEETTFFTISPALELESNGPNATSQIHLSTANHLCRNTEWNFYARLDFDITTSNWAKIYLTGDRSNIEDNPNGYYVKFDGNSNSVDLYRQDSLTHTKLISGKNGRAGKTSLNIFKIKVICDPSGNWHLFSDSTATGNLYVKEGSASDTTFFSSSYCGVYFAHSATRRKLFYFDDFSISAASLSLLDVKTLSNTSIELTFNNALNPLSASALSNYSLLPSLSINTASIDPHNSHKVILHLSQPLVANINYSISIHSLTDESSNLIGILNNRTFQYRINTFYGDVIITELFPDPTPAKGLPEYEYVELFNRTDDSLHLEGFLFSDGSSNAVLPSVKIAPKQYLILCASGSTNYFSNYSPVVGVPNFPSLNNSSDHLTLKNQNGILLHEVEYSDLWYEDNDKKEGGWALEMIDINNPCGGATNWTASLNSSGGTPGYTNSVAASKPDLEAPQLLSANITDSIHVTLVFTEKPDTTILSVSNFQFDKNIHIQKIKLMSETNLILTVDNVFLKGELYHLTFSGIKDCNGNSSVQSTTTLVMPQAAGAGDIVINEALFNPKTGGYDFVELYNRSSKYVDLKNWLFANTEDSLIANKELISSDPLILQPQEYIAFTENKSILMNHYPLGRTERIVEIPDLPSYNDDNGSVILLNDKTQWMDRFDYSEDFHFALIDDKEGVSLERISPDEPSGNPYNWQSASSQSGYATPGYRNSQQTSQTNGTQVWIEPKIFTPDENGDKDFAMINYKFETSGNMVNITIFDPKGREMIKLARNELLAAEGFYRWDGNNALNEKVRTGPYIIYFELFNLNGDVKKFKEVVVVGW